MKPEYKHNVQSFTLNASHRKPLEGKHWAIKRTVFMFPVLCPFSTPCQIITPVVEIAIWLPNPNPSPTPNPKPTNTRGVIIWQGSEFDLLILLF